MLKISYYQNSLCRIRETRVRIIKIEHVHMRTHNMSYINGQWVNPFGQGTSDIINPTTGEISARVSMENTPILRPVRKFNSSGMLLEKGRESELWKTMVKYEIDLYIAGKLHAVTCTQKDGIQHSHSGLIGRTDKPNYMDVTFHKD